MFFSNIFLVGSSCWTFFLENIRGSLNKIANDLRRFSLLTVGQSSICTAAGEYYIHNWFCLALDAEISSKCCCRAWTRFKANDCQAFFFDNCPCLHQVCCFLFDTFICCCYCLTLHFIKMIHSSYVLFRIIEFWLHVPLYISFMMMESYMASKLIFGRSFYPFFHLFLERFYSIISFLLFGKVGQAISCKSKNVLLLYFFNLYARFRIFIVAGIYL